MPASSPSHGRNDQPVVDGDDAGRRPRRVLGGGPLRERVHGPLQNDRAVVRLDRHALGVDVGAPLERLLDAVADVRRRDRRLDDDPVGYALDAVQCAIAFSAASRWYCHGTVPLSVTHPSRTVT